MGPASHVAHSRASRTHNLDALFFLLGWARCGFYKKHVETRYAELLFLYPVGSVGHVVHFGATGARDINELFFMLMWARCGFHKNHARTCYIKLVLTSGGICRSRSAFQCVRAVKYRFTIFHDGVGLVWIPQKAHRDTLR
jgi:hypothetical protein